MKNKFSYLFRNSYYLHDTVDNPPELKRISKEKEFKQDKFIFDAAEINNVREVMGQDNDLLENDFDDTDTICVLRDSVCKPLIEPPKNIFELPLTRSIMVAIDETEDYSRSVKSKRINEKPHSTAPVTPNTVTNQV